MPATPWKFTGIRNNIFSVPAGFLWLSSARSGREAARLQDLMRLYENHREKS